MTRFLLALGLTLLSIFGLACRGPAAAQQSTPSTTTAAASASAVASRSSNPPTLALETFDQVWRILKENHFDTNFNGHNWLAVKEQFRPRVQAARTQGEFREVTEEMLKLLNVSHLALVAGDLEDEPDAASKKGSAVERADEEESGTLGFDVRFLGDNLLVTRVEEGLPGANAGVKPGWIVRRIGSKYVVDILAKQPKNIEPRRRSFLAWRAASKQLSGPRGSEVEIDFLDGANQPIILKIKRGTARGEPIEFGNLPSLYTQLNSTFMLYQKASIGVIGFNIWMLPTALNFHRAIDEHRGRDGIIIDLRGNIGGVVGMIIGVAGHFVTQPMVLGSVITRDNTLKLPANPRFSDSTGKRAEPFSGPVAILVDEITASASEVFAGGLQELGRVRVFGRTTAGQALPAVFDKLPNGDLLYHPVADFVTPKGTRFEGRGVVPDVEVPLDRSALIRGFDPTLDAAARWIVEQKRASGKL